MKISKLFHWLYAALMFLPIALICSRTLYTIFNNNAKDSYYGETINEETNILISSFNTDDLYYFNAGNFDNTTLNPYQIGTSNRIYINIKEVFVNPNNLPLDDTVAIAFYKNSGSNDLFIYGYDTDNNTIFNTINVNNLNLYFDFQYVSGSLNSNMMTNNTLFYTKEYNDYSFLDNAFTYSLNEINTNPIFSWATNTYISQPLTYVTGLFGLEGSNPINTLISYWFSVSIFWMVFDIMIYVPMMIHRWLDKASIS